VQREFGNANPLHIRLVVLATELKIPSTNPGRKKT
jgi:hypothetical protein